SFVQPLIYVIYFGTIPVVGYYSEYLFTGTAPNHESMSPERTWEVYWNPFLSIHLLILGTIAFVTIFTMTARIWRRMASGKNTYLANMLTMFLVLLFGFLGLKFSDSNFLAALWVIFLVLAYPLVIAFMLGIANGTAKFTEKGLVDLYRTGVSQIPVISKFV